MSSKVLSRPVTPADLPLISALHARVFGPGRFARTAYRVRERAARGAKSISPFCRLALLGDRIVAAVRLSEIVIGGTGQALLLGPLVVASEVAGQGFGRGLVASAIEAARSAGHRLVLLVGDESYYARFGFKPVPEGQIVLPGPVDPARLLAVELADGALADYRGVVAPAN